MKTTQKLIKIGSSYGVTIPKKQIADLGLKPGDSVNIDIKPTGNKLQEFSKEFDGFMDKYQKDLQNLAKR